jgi:hypothetical protein
MRKHKLGIPVMIGLAGILAATVALAAMAATARVAAKPTNTTPPTISGNPSEGSTLKATNGQWSGGGTMTFAYQWRRCDSGGNNCSDISGATQQTYKLQTADSGNTLRVIVTATSSDGSTPVTSAQTSVISATPAPPTTGTGCPSGASGSTVAVTDVNAPARLQIDQFQATPAVIPGNMQSFTMKVHVMNTCGQVVSGAQVYATAVPFNQVNIPTQVTTGSDGWATLQFNRQHGFPAATKQRLLVMFVRAGKPGDNILAGISTRRLVSFRVNLKASV